MTILRLLTLIGLTGIVFSITQQHFAIWCFVASVLPVVFATSYFCSLARSSKIAAIGITFVAMMPIYLSSMGPLNALIAVQFFCGYQTPALDRAILTFYRPLNLLPWTPGLSASFEQYLIDWNEIGRSACRRSPTPNATTGISIPQGPSNGG